MEYWICGFVFGVGFCGFWFVFVFWFLVEIDFGGCGFC